jgi:molecular chaperone HtpG
VDKDKNEYKTLDEQEQVNQASALWARPKSEITDEQYQEFYKHRRHTISILRSPGRTRESRAKQEYTLFCICRHVRRSISGIAIIGMGSKLYVQRVFIMDDAEQLGALLICASCAG